MSEGEGWSDCRFAKADIPYLADILELPEKMTCYNRTTAGKEEALYIPLRKMASPCRFGDMVPCFGRSVPELSLIFNETVNHVYSRFEYLLHALNHAWIRPHDIQLMADTVHDKGAALPNCWGFVDGTVSEN